MSVNLADGEHSHDKKGDKFLNRKLKEETNCGIQSIKANEGSRH